MSIKLNSVGVAAVLATPAGITVPAFAQTKATPSWDTCYSLSVERGAVPARGAGTNAAAQHNAFTDQCLAGENSADGGEEPASEVAGRRFRLGFGAEAYEPAPRGDQVANGTRHATLKASIGMAVETRSHGCTADRCLAIFTSEVCRRHVDRTLMFSPT
jgi:uncharacterized membrane protein